MTTYQTKEELREIYGEQLVRQGFRPETDADGDLAFRFEGGSYCILLSPDDPNYVAILMPGIWRFDAADEPARARDVALRVMMQYKVIKVAVYRDAVSLVVEMFLPRQEDLDLVLMRSLRLLQETSHTFHNVMREGVAAKHSRDERDEALGPRGRQALTMGGHVTIDRPSFPEDPVTDAFERHLLRWIEEDLKLRPVCHAGSNAIFWRIDIEGKPVDIGIVGRLRHPTTELRDGVDWILRVEEEEPADFIAGIERWLGVPARVRRQLAREKIRVQFASTDVPSPA